MPHGALESLKVLDLTHHVAGPYCTKLLADYGAEVVKIERPVLGDPCRRMGPFAQDEPDPEKSLLFAYLNTNKRSVTLDLKTQQGQQILRALLEGSDVIVESFSPRVMPSLGLGYDSLKQVKPDIVMASISSFGQTGPYRDYKATEIVEYALGGLMYVFGSNGREPLKHALNQAQLRAGTNAATAVVAAVLRQQLTGQGDWIDVSIQETVASGLRDTTCLYSYMGATRGRQPEDTGDIPVQPMETRDGYAVPIAFGGADWDTTADFLNEPRLFEERFSTRQRRVESSRELNEVLRETFLSRGKFDTFYEAHKRRGLIYGVVQTPQDVIESPQYRARGYFVEIEHPAIGAAEYPGAPFIMRETPWHVESPAPALGQHSGEVLSERLGCSDDDLARLEAEGVI